MTAAEFAQNMAGGEVEDTFHLVRHGIEPELFFVWGFFVRAFKEGENGVTFAASVAFGEFIEINAEGDLWDVAVIDAVGADLEAFCPFFEVLSSFGKAVAEHGGLGG